MKWPYGISDFSKIRTGNFLYVDKTMYIEKLESLSSEYVFFIRPRRFGKSLFLSTLEHYYDVNRKEDFERLFGDLYIGKHPTERRNQYFILRLNFSGIHSSKDKLESSFGRAFKDAVIGFFNTYADYFEDASTLKDEIRQCDDLRSVWNGLFEAVKRSKYKIYLIIDEYDHFANKLIAMGDGSSYKEMVRATGFVRNFYETVKIGTESVIDRIFITGVSPIMLDDLTSGFNISENLTMDPVVGEMLGFTEEEVSEMVAPLQSNIDLKTLMDGLRSNYNGYLFYEGGTSKVYNPTMVLYFLNKWDRLGDFPKQLVDENVKTDYHRLRQLITHDQNRAKLEEIIINGRVKAQIVTRFSFDSMYDEKYFVSLLFYMGLLTLQVTEDGSPDLVIPNYVIKTVFWEYFGHMLEETTGIRYEAVNELRDAVRKMAFDGEIERFAAFIREKMLRVLSRRDLRRFGESQIKMIVMSYLSLTNIYRQVSEREVENGYMDILLERNDLMPEVKVEWLLELKYIKKSLWKSWLKGRDYVEKIRQEAIEQLRKYEVEGKPQLHKAALIFIGKDEFVLEVLPPI